MNKEDLNYGFQQEDTLLETIKNKFGYSFKKTSKYHAYDYTDGEIYIELKSRRCNYNSYPTTMIGYNKLVYAMNNPNKKFKFLFNFYDGLYSHDFDTEKDYKIRTGGRSDRGRLELSKYAYIPISELTLI